MTKLLCIIDEKVLCDVFKAYLESKGIESHTAYTKVEAIEKLKAIMPDIAIINMEQEEQYGVDIITEAKAIKPDIKTIFIIGLIDEDLQQKAKERGVDVYLEKTFPLNVLYDHIQALINKIQK